jgi:hypothetical protein
MVTRKAKMWYHGTLKLSRRQVQQYKLISSVVILSTAVEALPHLDPTLAKPKNLRRKKRRTGENHLLRLLSRLPRR